MELDKKLNRIRIALDNAVGDQVGMKWEIHTENGANIYWLVMWHVDGIESSYAP